MDDAAVSRYWDGNAAAWTQQVRMGYDLYREKINNPAMFGLLGDLSGKDVIDLGCGEGYNTRRLARGAQSVHGVDISDRMIRFARQSEQEEPLGIEYHVASFSNLSSVASQTFDVAVSFMAFMDGADYAGAIAETARVLRRGGTLVFSILHPCFATPELGWLRNELGEEDRLTVGQYFARATGVDEWSFTRSPIAADLPPFQVPRFHRTLSDYLNPLCRNGFCIEQIVEPQAAEPDFNAYPFLAKWSRHAALFLHVKAKKR